MSSQNHASPEENPPIRRSIIDLTISRLMSAPWWVIALSVIFAATAVAVGGSKQYKDILLNLLDNPQTSTEDKFDVVYQLDTPVVVLSHTLNLQLPDGSPITIPAEDVLERREGTLICDQEANPECLNQFGDLVEFRMPVPEGSAPDGTVERRGLLRGLVIELPTGEIVLYNPETTRIISQETGTLECNRFLKPECENLSGDIVTFEYPYSLSTGLIEREDLIVQHDDGYQETVRPNRITNLESQSCTTESDALCLNGTIMRAGFAERVTGTEVGREDGIVRIRTVDEEIIDVPVERIMSQEEGLVECDRSANPRCLNFEGTIVQRRGAVTEGELTLENNRSLNIVPVGQTAAVEIRKSSIISDVRNPENCRVEDEGPCNVVVEEEDDVVAGRLVAENANSISVQTVAPVFIEIPQDSLEIKRTPMVCALDNLRGCNEAIWLTLIVTFSAYSLALVGGLVIGLMRVSSNPFLYHPATLYVEIIRGLPLLVLLLFFAYGLGPALRDNSITRPFYDLISSIEVLVLGQESALAEAVLGLAVGYAAFLAEVFRAGIQSIGKGQMEAARSLGMTYPQAMRKVVLPQAIRVVLPPLGNDFIAMLKDSALVSVLALPELLQSGRLYIARTYQAIPVYLMVALVYIMLTLVLSTMIRFVEKRFRLP